MRVHLIHGIHATRPGGNTSRLAAYFRDQGFEVVVHAYGYALALTSGLTNWLNQRRAAKLAQHIADGDVIVAHSNGCAVAYLIQRDHRHLKAAIMINGALDGDTEFENTDQVLVLHNDGDGVVWLSELAPFSSWGAMGRSGYFGKHDNVENIDCASPPAGLPPLWGHSALFEDENRPYWGSYLARRLHDLLRRRPVDVIPVPELEMA